MLRLDPELVRNPSQCWRVPEVVRVVSHVPEERGVGCLPYLEPLDVLYVGLQSGTDSSATSHSVGWTQKSLGKFLRVGWTQKSLGKFLRVGWTQKSFGILHCACMTLNGLLHGGRTWRLHTTRPTTRLRSVFHHTQHQQLSMDGRWIHGGLT